MGGALQRSEKIRAPLSPASAAAARSGSDLPPRASAVQGSADSGQKKDLFENLVQPVEFDLMFEARIIDLAVCLAAFR